MKSARTIALPISSFLPNLGGAEVGLHNIACKLLERERRPIVMAPEPHVRFLRENGWKLPYAVEALPKKAWSLLRYMPWLGFSVLDRYFGKMQNRHGFDFWHCTVGYPTGVALVHFANRRDDIRYLIRCAGEDIQRDPEIGYGARLDPKVDRVVREYLPQAQLLVAISESVADEYRALGVSDRQIRHVPNGVDLSRFTVKVDRQAVRRSHGIDPNCFLFISVGRNHPKKNYDRLLDAAAQLARSGGPSFQLAIVGRHAKALVGRVKALDLGRWVILIDEIGQDEAQASGLRLPALPLVELYRAADAFVFPSLIETFGIAVVEAMAAGLPTIVGDSPGCRDVVRNGRDGIVVSPRDPTAIARAMALLMSDGGVRSDYAARANARAKDFSWDTVVDSYVAIYDETVARDGRA